MNAQVVANSRYVSKYLLQVEHSTGQIDKHKGVQVVIDAFREIAGQFPDARVIIARSISDWNGDAWDRALRHATNADRVIVERASFLRETPDVARWMEATGFRVAPSLLQDPAPNLVIGGNRARRPSIVFPNGGAPPKDGIGGAVCREASVDALATALRLYLADPALVRRFDEAARDALTRSGTLAFAGSRLSVYEAVSSPRRTVATERREPLRSMRA